MNLMNFWELADRFLPYCIISPSMLIVIAKPSKLAIEPINFTRNIQVFVLVLLWQLFEFAQVRIYHLAKSTNKLSSVWLLFFKCFQQLNVLIVLYFELFKLLGKIGPSKFPSPSGTVVNKYRAQKLNEPDVQLCIRAFHCSSEGRGFESHYGHVQHIRANFIQYSG